MAVELASPGVLLPAAVLAGLLALAAALAALAVLARRPPAAGELSASLQPLLQAVQQGQAQAAVLSDRLARLEPVAQAVGDLRVELRALSERVLQVEQAQTRVHQGVVALGNGLVETGAVARGLAEATAAIREELSRAKQELTELRAGARARHDLEQRTAESIRRLETVIAGAHTKGAAGEQVLEAVFAKLPADWQVRDLRVGDRVVEFGLRLPSGSVLPIDSKWAATELVARLAGSDDPAERQRLKAEIEAAVRARAKEVRKYLDPAVTTPFGVAAVPDAVYDLSSGILAELFQSNVVLVSYSLFVPYLLLVFQTTLKASRQVDLARLEAFLAHVEESVAALRDELDGRLARAITMLQNSRAEMAAYVSRVHGGAAGIRAGAAGLPAGEAGQAAPAGEGAEAGARREGEAGGAAPEAEGTEAGEGEAPAPSPR